MPKKEDFLKALKEIGTVQRACNSINIHRNTAYEWKHADPDFSAKWDAVVESHIEELETEARRRAYEGVKKPVYQGGELVGHVQEYSDTLLIFLLKGRRPEVFAERSRNVTLNLDANTIANLPDSELDRLIDALEKRAK